MQDSHIFYTLILAYSKLAVSIFPFGSKLHIVCARDVRSTDEGHRQTSCEFINYWTQEYLNTI